MSISSNEQKKDIDTILKQLQVFEKLLIQEEYSPTLKPKYNTVFYLLLNKIDHLQIGLNKRYLNQQQKIVYIRATIILSLLIYLLYIFYLATKRKMIREKLLQESQKTNYFLKETQKISKVIPYSYNFKTNYWEVSKPAVINLIGHKVSLQNNNFWLDIIHPKDRTRISNLFKLREGNLLSDFNEIYRITNTTTLKTHWIHHVVQGIKKDKKGNLLPIQGVIQDITQHKLAEEKIRRSNTILNKINSIVLVIDYENNVSYASRGVKYILGYNYEDMLGNGWWEITYPDTKTAQIDKDFNLNYFFNKNSSLALNSEFSLRKIKTKDGNYKWIKWSFTKESENSLVAIGVDVTESYEKSEQFTTLTEIAHDAIVLANDKGIITEVNRSARQMFGYTKKEILGKPVNILMPENLADFFIKELSSANKKGVFEKSEFRTGKGLTKKGLIFPVEISFNSWANDNGQTHCAFIKDVTQQKHEAKIKEIIYNITKYAQEKPTLDELLPFIKESLGGIIDVSMFFVSLYDDKKQRFDSYEKIDIKNHNKFINFPRGESLFDHVIDTKKSLLYTKSSKIKSDTKSKCWMGVPLMVKQKAIGVMSVRSYTDKNAYSQKDVDLLELVASTISQVIQQTKDFEKINLLNQALTQSSTIIIITNIKGEIEYVNPYFTKTTGYEPNEVISKNPKIFGIKNNNNQKFTALWKTITKGKSWKGEFTNLKKDGSPFTVLTTIAPVKNNTGEIAHYISVQEDITEKLKLEAQFINGFIEAQEIERQSFGEELHDGISQILSAETMYIDVLIKENQDRINGKAKFLTKIKELNLSAANEARNIAHGLMSNQLMKIGLIKAIENICIDYSDTKNIKFTYSHKNISENELSKEIKVNLFRIIQETTTNIIRHSRATQATITFTKLKNNTLNLIIEDNGIGIDYDKTKGKPKGIGFDNIKRRITLLKGTLNIDTSPNNGLRFNINIPL